jgi:dihydroorotate dehydrogenase (fumarate)
MNLETTYLGLTLKNPLLHSASPLTRKISNLQKLEEAGIGAIVMHSLFEEQIETESLMLNAVLQEGAGSFGEAYDYIPRYAPGQVGPEIYLEHLTAAKAAVGVPIIGSLNGRTNGGWTKYAKKIEEAGADALELNLYNVPSDPDVTCSEIEETYLGVVRAVCRATTIPVAVKISPFLTAPANFCMQLAEAGAKGVVLFNRFFQPDIDLEELKVVPNLQLSRPEELRLPLRWTALLSGRLPADIALTGGIHSGQDIVKGILCGATAAMMTSELLLRGIDSVTTCLESLSTWMEENEYVSVTQMRGAMCQDHAEDPDAYERANYLKVLGSYTA